MNCVRVSDAVQLRGCLEVKYVFKDVQKKSLDLPEFIRMTEREVTLTALVSALDCEPCQCGRMLAAQCISLCSLTEETPVGERLCVNKLMDEGGKSPEQNH